MLALGIDTSDGVSVALLDGEHVLARASGADPRRHSESLAPAVSFVLAEAGAAARDLEAVAVGTGPAPFTGLRVGLVTARSLARSLGIPALGVCALDALARQAFDAFGEGAQVLAVTDARRREVYCARYAAAGKDVERLTRPEVSTPAGLSERIGSDVVIVGRGARLYPDALPPADGAPEVVDAAVLARLAVHRATHGGELGLEPRYLRRPDVSLPAARKRAS